MRTSQRLATSPRAVWTSRLQAALQPAAWTGWDLLPAEEGARARTERATPWTRPTGAPQSVWRPQRRPSHRTPWTPETAAWSAATLTRCRRRASLSLTVRDTPAPSPPNSGPIATPCTFGETTSGHTRPRRGCRSGRACPLEPAASSCCLRSCSTARFLATLEAPPEKKTWAGSASSSFQSSPPHPNDWEKPQPTWSIHIKCPHPAVLDNCLSNFSLPEECRIKITVASSYEWQRDCRLRNWIKAVQ